MFDACVLVKSLQMNGAEFGCVHSNRESPFSVAAVWIKSASSEMHARTVPAEFFASHASNVGMVLKAKITHSIRSVLLLELRTEPSAPLTLVVVEPALMETTSVLFSPARAVT